VKKNIVKTAVLLQSNVLFMYSLHQCVFAQIHFPASRPLLN